MPAMFDFRRCIVLAAAFLAATLLPRPSLAGDETACATAGTVAEHRYELPPGLLLAIGRVESGRRDPASGRMTSWPWTINAAGDGRSFNDLSAVLAATHVLLAQGVASIDVGCFQINLVAHQQAFINLEQAFDPSANADYEARFLVMLRAQTGSWERAIAAYHSATPARGRPYSDLVLAAWGRPPLPADTSTAPLPPHPATLQVLQVMAWSQPRAGVQIWSPSPGGGPSIIRFPGSPALPTVFAPGR